MCYSRHPSTLSGLGFLVSFAALLVSCSGGSSTDLTPTPGDLEVSVETTGEDLDDDGYEVAVTGHGSRTVSPNGSTVFADLAPGPYGVTLSGIAENCSVEGESSRSVTVTEGPSATPLTFRVSCQATTGDLVVTTVTTGENQDPDGYLVRVDESITQSSATSGEVEFTDLPAGAHSVELEGIAENCAVDGPNPRNVTVAAGGSAQTTFTVECAALTGQLTVDVETTGSDQDSDGYTLTVDGGTPTPVGSNESVVFDAVAAGSRSVELTGLAENCAVNGANPKTASVPEGGSATVEFSVACGALTGDLEVQIETSGEDLDPDGYSVLLDGASAKTTSVNDTVAYENIGSGDYSVELSGVAENCSVSGANPRTVTVSAGATETTAFAVTCSSTTGELRVGASTTGDEIDPDGYVASVNGGARTTRIEVNGETGFGGLAVGDHQVALEDVAENCQVIGDNPRTVTVTGGETASTTFTVECNPTKGEIRVRVNTSGQDQDPNGYVAEIDGGVRTTRLDPNDETGFGGLAAGGHQVELTDVASNCTVLGANPRTITAVAGETVLTTFGIECEGEDLIAFATDRDGNYNIYVMKPDGSEPVKLTDDVAHDTEPKWSPDGTRIAFASQRDGNYEIYLMDYPSRSLTRLTDSPATDREAVWSPDGQRIAFTSDRTGNKDVFVINADGTGLVNISNDPTDNYSPFWSPDGAELTYGTHSKFSTTYVYVASVDGTGAKSIAGGDFIRNVAWSPDGTRITYDDDYNGMAWASPDGSEGGHYGTLNQTRHAWSNDGTRIAYYHPWHQYYNLYVMNGDGSAKTQLTNFDFGDNAAPGMPSWSPDDNHIVFSKPFYDGTFETIADIFKTSTSGIDHVNLTDNATNDVEPDWRP